MPLISLIHARSLNATRMSTAAQATSSIAHKICRACRVGAAPGLFDDAPLENNWDKFKNKLKLLYQKDGGGCQPLQVDG